MIQAGGLKKKKPVDNRFVGFMVPPSISGLAIMIGYLNF